MLLTRLLGYKLWAHVVYLIISVALLGIGIGSLLVTAFGERISRWSEENRSRFLIGVLLSIPPLFVGAAYLLSILPHTYLNAALVGRAIKAYAVVLPPFIATGVGLSTLFRMGRSEDFRNLYFFDLLGAGLGVLFFFPCLSWFGLIGSFYALGVFVAFASIGLCTRWEKTAAIPFVAGFLALAIFLPESRIPMPIQPGKELQYAQTHMAGQYDITHSQWYPLGKVEVLKPMSREAEKTYSALTEGAFTIPLDPPPSFQAFINNAAAGTPAYELSEAGIARHHSKVQLFSTVMELPFTLTKDPRVFVIGAGGGRDVYTSLLHGATQVVGAEINPVTCQLMKTGFLAEYTGNVYTRPGVNVSCTDGRQVAKTELMKGPAHFDLIVLNGIDTFTGVSNGSYTFSESYIYTQEAVDEYVDLLADNGILNLNRWHFTEYPKETLRLFIQGMDSLRRTTSRPWDHVFYARYSGWGMLLVKKTPFTPTDVTTLENYLSRFKDTEILFKPHGTNSANFFSQYVAAAKAGDAQEKWARVTAPYDINPVTDNSPFFFKYYKLSHIPFVFSTMAFMDATPNGGFQAFYVQMTVVLLGILAVLGFLVLPQAFLLRGKGSWRPLASCGMVSYFGAIALGYMFIQITLMQKVGILFGSPIYPLAIVMSTMLLGTALGSMFSTKNSTDSVVLFGRLSRSLVILSVSILLLSFASTPVVDFLLTRSFWESALVVGMVSFGIGAVLGFFLPIGIHFWSSEGSHFIPWSYAINSAVTVIGAMVSTLIAQVVGFHFLFVISLCLYLVAWATLKVVYYEKLRKTEQSSSDTKPSMVSTSVPVAQG